MNELILKYALKNAVEHKGTAQAGSVISGVLYEKPELKNSIKELMKDINETIKKVNSMSQEEQKEKLEKLAPELLEKKEARTELPDLKNAVKGSVTLRIEPSPSGRIGAHHTRVALVNQLYKEKYEGKLIIRFSDTDPNKVEKDSYKFILKDFEWLGVKPDLTYSQSDRLSRYYEVGRELITKGSAFACYCKQKNTKCACKKAGIKENLEAFEKMLKGAYKEGEVVIRFKSPEGIKDPAQIDFGLFRIVSKSHPKHPQNKVWPMMSLAVSADDHDYALTHVIRGIDNEPNTPKQKQIFKALNWKEPEYIHIGAFLIPGTMHKSEIRELIQQGKYSGWDDVRLMTISALRRKGIQPEIFKELVIEAGISKGDSRLEPEKLYTLNRKLLDPKSKRYFFIQKPKKAVIKKIPKTNFKLRLHPEKDLGYKHYELQGNEKFYLPEKIPQKSRLKDLFNIKNNEFESKEVKEGIKKTPWVLVRESMPCSILMHDNNYVKGYCEKACEKLRTGEIIQFETFGFARIEENSEKGIKAVYAHK